MLDLLNGIDALVYDPRAGEWPGNVDINHSNDAVMNHGPNAIEGDSGSAVTVSSDTQLQGLSTQSLLSGIPYHAAGTWSGSTCLNSVFGLDALDVLVLPDGHIAACVPAPDIPTDTCG
jgi:hypothetical protein